MLKFLNLLILLYVQLLFQEVGQKSLWLVINRSFLSKIIIATDANKDGEDNHTFFKFLLIEVFRNSFIEENNIK